MVIDVSRHGDLSIRIGKFSLLSDSDFKMFFITYGGSFDLTMWEEFFYLRINNLDILEYSGETGLRVLERTEE